MELYQAKYDKYIRGHKNKKKKRQDWKLSNAHMFIKIIVIMKRYGGVQDWAPTVQEMVKMIMVYKSNADSKHKIFLG